MLILNFAHPITPEQLLQVENLTNQQVEQVLDLPVHFENENTFQPQLAEVLRQVPLTPQEWQTAPIVVNLPAYNYISALLLAELHGRMGYFPPILRLRPVEHALPPQFEVAEVINLHAIRDTARRERF